MDPLAAFSPRTREWFERAFAAPTPAQQAAWPAIARGHDVLVQAPTGSGKTLAAFLTGIDRLDAEPGAGLRLLYISPLKALNYDIERNLRGPLAGLGSQLTIGVRTGDTDQRERRQMARTPPDILITTPESLFLLLTSQARQMLKGVETVIIDEVHAVAGTKRGAHLALSLERLGSPDREAVPAHRALRDPAAARRDRPLRLGRPPHRARRCGLQEGARPRGRDRARGHARARVESRPGSAGARGRCRDGAGLRADGPVDLAFDLPCPARPRAATPLDDRLRQQPPARRAPCGAAERARRGGDRARASRLLGPRAACRDRGAPQGRPDSLPRRHLEPRARHRHGCSRSRDPGREPEVGGARAAAGG